jgi:hypothetical protein
MNAPLPVPTEAEALHDLAWWAAERESAGTDWHTLLLDTVRALRLVAPCDVCECEPCPTPSFCHFAREADAKRARERPQVRKPQPRPTPQSTIEAIKQSVRDRGIAVLKESATRDRLSQCDQAARAEIDGWLTRFKSKVPA